MTLIQKEQAGRAPDDVPTVERVFAAIVLLAFTLLTFGLGPAFLVMHAVARKQQEALRVRRRHDRHSSALK